MRDNDLAASIAAHDPAALAEAWDKYAARVFSFCRSLLGDSAAAADAVHDTFLITAEAMAELHDPARLRPWLYAVARNQCHRRLRAGVRPVAPAEIGGRGRPGDDDHSQLLDLVHTAISGLDTADGEIVELNLRHRLHGTDLADTLGVAHADVHPLALRAHGRLRESLGALLVAQAGRKNCDDLEELLGEQDGTTPLARGLTARHVENCPVCADRQRQLLSPVMRLGFVSMAPVPPGLRSRVLGLASDPSPAAAAQRAAVLQQAGPFGAYGFPEPLAAGTRRPRRHRRVPVPAIAGAAATAVAAAAAAVVVLALPQSPHQGHSGLPAQLTRPISPAADNGSAAQPSGPATGQARTPAGTQNPASTVRIQNGGSPYGGANGALAVQDQSLAATGSSGAKSGSTGQASTAPASHPAGSGNGVKGTPPSKTATPTTSPTPTTSTSPTTSPTPTTSGTPTTSPTPSDSPSTGDTSAPTAGASLGVSVGGLVSVGVQLGG